MKNVFSTLGYCTYYFIPTPLQNLLTGWNFAQLTDVVVHRVRNGEPMTDERNTARLVYSDGCRNPAYRVLAPVNPWRDGSNGLINNFDFRVFMFQQMESGDAIMITAKVRAGEGIVSRSLINKYRVCHFPARDLFHDRCAERWTR